MTAPYRILDLPIVGRIRIAKLRDTRISGAMVSGLAAFPKQLGIGEFPRAQRPQLPADAEALHPAKRGPRVRPHKVVDEHRTALDLCRYRDCARRVFAHDFAVNGPGRARLNCRNSRLKQEE
jgi:hypothetical protein